MKPRIRWEQVRGPRAFAATFVATALGAGFFPIAPGTMGTLAAVPLAYLTAEWTAPFRGLLWLAITAIGTWSAKVIDEVTGTSDNQSIVIDEVVGFGISAWTAGRDAKALIAAFVLFRLFDTTKPPPIRQLDRMSKGRTVGAGAASAPSHVLWWRGFGVIADDILAGFMALACVFLLQRLDIWG